MQERAVNPKPSTFEPQPERLSLKYEALITQPQSMHPEPLLLDPKTQTSNLIPKPQPQAPSLNP